MISSISILSVSGELLLYHPLKYDSLRHDVILFNEKLSLSRQATKLPPILTVNECHFLYVAQVSVLPLVSGLVKCYENIETYRFLQWPAIAKGHTDMLSRLLVQIVSYLLSPDTRLELHDIYIRAEMLYEIVLVASTRKLIPCYCKAKYLTKRAIQEHFLLLYQILDEALCFGLPQTLEGYTLKQLIQRRGTVKTLVQRPRSSWRLTHQVTNTTYWRIDGIKYRKNEIYMNVVESVSLQVNRKGVILNKEILGKIFVKCHLSGTPECRLGLAIKRDTKHRKSILYTTTTESSTTTTRTTPDTSAPKTTLAPQSTSILPYCRYHQCVRLDSIVDAPESITFIPPDGVFQLLSYRLTKNIFLPLEVHFTAYEQTKARFSFQLYIKSWYPRSVIASRVSIRIPCPKSSATANITILWFGRAVLDPAENAIVWRLKHFPGMTQTTLEASVNLLPSVEDSHASRPPIQVDFLIPTYLVSGVEIPFLTVTEISNYSFIKWMHCDTRAGSIQYQV